MPENKTPPGQIIRESAQYENAVGDALDDAMAEQALAGVYASGRRIMRTERYRDVAKGTDNLRFAFEDGSMMTISGQGGLAVTFFTDRLAQQGQKITEDVIEGEAVDADLVEHGKQLLSGDPDPDPLVELFRDQPFDAGA